MIKIYASELAACVGFNKFKSVEQVAIDVFARTDPIAYQKALDRNHLKQREAIENALENLHLTERVGNLVHDSGENYIKDLDKIIVELGDKADGQLLKDLTSYVFTERGKISEDSSINMFENEMKKIVNNRNNKFYKKFIDYFPNSENDIDKTTENVIDKKNETETEITKYKKYMIGGKVDGITDDGTLVEVKNRQYKLFDRIPVYEKIQIHTYMFLTGILQCHYVQCYRDTSNTELLHFEQNFWDDVKSRLTIFVKKIDKVLSDQTIQDELVITKTFKVDFS